MGSRFLSFLNVHADRCSDVKTLRFQSSDGSTLHQVNVSQDVLMLFCEDLRRLHQNEPVFDVPAPAEATVEDCQAFVRALLRGEQPTGPLAAVLATTLNGGEKAIRRRLQTRQLHDVVVTINEDNDGFAAHASILSAYSTYFAHVVFPSRCIVRMLGFSHEAVKSVIGFLYTGEVDRRLKKEFFRACVMLGINTEGVRIVDRDVVVSSARATDLTGAKVHRVDGIDLARKREPAEGLRH